MTNKLTAFVKARYTPTSDQNKALEKLEDFLQGNQNCFLLKGYAGTGKTFLTKWLVDYFTSEKKKVTVMAPTGRAARILKEKTGCEATTIHKGIYNLSEVDEISTGKEGKEKYKFRYNLNHIETNIQNIYLVDEASMISDSYSEDDFFVFGSGHLLRDLLTFLALNNQGRNDKLIFIGDNAQLPPVTDRVSGALSSSYLLETYQILSEEYELTEVVRQSKESGILSNSIYIRNLLKDSGRNSFKLECSYDDTFSIRPEEVVETFLKYNKDLDTTKSVIINFSNKSALDYNLKVRERLFQGRKDVQLDEIMMIYQNNYNYEPELLNGMFVKVKEISPVPEIKAGMKSYDENGEDCDVTHIFRKVVLEVPIENRLVDVECMILENFLYSSNPTLDYSENIALYIDFKMRYPGLKSKTKEFADALRKDLYFNALRVKFGYAITCHKAQGGEWDSALVNLDVSQSKLSDNFLRWTYTAITRARKDLFLFNLSNVNQFTTLTYNHKLLTDAQSSPTILETVQFVLPQEFERNLEQFQLKDAPTFLQNKYIELLARFNNSGIEIVERKAYSFQEAYIFKKADKNIGFSFWYNGKNHFTRFNKTHNTGDEAFFSEVKQYIERPFNFHLVTGPTEVDNLPQDAESLDFQEGKKTLEVLHLELNRLLHFKEAKVKAIKHNAYQEQYYITRGNEYASINFYYDGKQRFTTAEPYLQKCNSNLLLNDLAEAIDQLKTL